MDKLKHVSKQTLWQLLAKAASSLSTILILALVTRHFGPSLTGVFTLALTYLSFFNLLTDFGFNAHLLPQLVEDHKHQKWQKLLTLRLIWSAFLLILAIFLIPLIPSQTPLLTFSIILGSFSILGYGLFITAQALFQSRIRYDLSTICSVLGSITTLAISWLVVSQSWPLPSLLTATSIGGLIAGLVGLGLVIKLVGRIRWDWSKAFVKETFYSAWPISLTLIFNLIYFRLDSFILSSLRSFSEVGIYNLAYSIFQSILVLPTFIMNSYYPLILRHSQSLASLRQQFKQIFLVMFGLSVAASLVTYWLSPVMINLISGSPAFNGSIRSLQILSVGLPAFFLSSVGMWWFIYKKRYKSLALIYLAGLTLNTILNLIFIPQYSYLASSWITVGSEYLILILQATILTSRVRDN